MDIKYLYENTELTIAQIAEQVHKTYRQVQKYIADNYSSAERRSRKAKTYRNSKLGDKNPMQGKCSTEHQNFIGVVSDSKGYLMVLKPDWYTGRKGSKHVFQHHVVVCANLGITCIPKGWVVHHVDMNPHNNDFSNLVLCTMNDHPRIHKHFEGATTISKESTLKWVETHGTVFNRNDIV